MNLEQSLLTAFGAHKRGDLDGAESGYLAILRSAPQIFDAIHLLGLVYKDRGRLTDADALVQTASLINQSHADVFANHAAVLNELGRYDEAAGLCRFALQLDSKSIPGHVNLGNALISMMRVHEAIQHYRAGLEVQPGNLKLIANLASALSALNKPDAVRETYLDGLGKSPDDPELNFGYAGYLLQSGDYAQGFLRYESRWRMNWFNANMSSPVAPRWHKNLSLAGRTILLRAEQGLGDTLQFARYIPLVAELASAVYVEVPATLLHLLSHNFGHLVQFISKGCPIPPVDFECPLLSLPLAFGTEATNIPFGTSAYLKAPATHVSSWAVRLPQSNMRRVGFVWNANRVNTKHARVSSNKRSVPLMDFFQLLRIPGISPVILQKESSREERFIVETALGINDLGSELSDFSDTAAIISQLDLVVTVDTSVAHLAGALGKPVWVLLPTASDWRWMRDRSDSPWYASARLFRQESPGDWVNVLDAVARGLKTLALKA